MCACVTVLGLKSVCAYGTQDQLQCVVHTCLIIYVCVYLEAVDFHPSAQGLALLPVPWTSPEGQCSNLTIPPTTAKQNQILLTKGLHSRQDPCMELR